MPRTAVLDFINRLGDATRSLSEPDDIMKVVATKVGTFMKASRCAYADVEADGNHFTIHQDYTDNCPSTAGSYQLNAFGDSAMKKLQCGETLVINDIDMELDEHGVEGQASFRAIGIHAMICCSLVKNGNLLAMMAVHQIEPRAWQPHEIELMREVVERCWDSIERVRSQKLAIRNEKKFREFFDYAPDAQLLIDDKGNVQRCNQRFSQLFELNPHEIIGKPATKVIPLGVFATPFISANNSPLEIDEPGRPLLINTPSGKQLYTENSQNIIHTDEGYVRSISIRDVSDRIRLEDELRQSKKMETVGMLAGGIAHDFNNILTIILGSAELALIDDDMSDDLRSQLEIIYNASSRAGELTQQLLAFSRQQVLKPELTDLNEKLLGFESLVDRLIGEKITVSLDLEPQLAAIKIDQTQLQQVVLNLSANARDAMPHGGQITMSTRNIATVPTEHDFDVAAEDGLVTLSISDTGVGISLDKLDNIFDPFYTTKEAGKGTGMGLSTVYGIVKQSGGDITVTSKEGEGTTFTLYFPASDRQPQNAISQNEENHDQFTGKVLIVEDEPELAEILAEMLVHIGFDVESTACGDQALKHFHNASDKFELVITDVIMPGLNGPDLAQRIYEAAPDTKILFTSGYTADTIGDHGMLDDDQNFLRKPYNLDELKNAVKRTLAGSQPE